MIRLDRLCGWIYVLALAMLPFHKIIQFGDEACYGILAMVAFIDCIFNKNWIKYRLLGLVIAIFLFYVVYSVTAVHYNTFTAVLKDMVIELKPYVSFFVFIAIGPKFSPLQKFIIKIECIAGALIFALSFIGGPAFIKIFLHHLAYLGQGATVFGLTYLFVSRNSDGSVPLYSFLVALAILCIGIPSGKAKFLGFMVLALFFFFIYKPGMFRNISLKKVILICAMIFFVLAASWNKISFYFLQSASSMIEITDEESMARPALYAGALAIMSMHLLFGSGLASFASFPSGEPYSSLYSKIGLDKVWGLSPSQHDFICDAFYPSLAQYGLVGIALFTMFWIYVLTRLNKMVRKDGQKYNIPYIVGVLIVCFILIESVAGTSFTGAFGQVALMLLGMICAEGNRKHTDVAINTQRVKPETFII